MTDHAAEFMAHLRDPGGSAGSLSDPVTGVVVDTGNVEEVRRKRPILTVVHEIRALKQRCDLETEGASPDFRRKHFTAKLESEPAASQLKVPLAKLAEAQRDEARARERITQLTSVGVMTRGSSDDSQRSAAREREIRDHIRAVDPVERPGMVRAALESGDPAAIRAVLDDPLEHIAGPLLARDELAPLVEACSRRIFPDAWERVDQQLARASELHTTTSLAIEALERITGAPLTEAGA